MVPHRQLGAVSPSVRRSAPSSAVPGFPAGPGSTSGCLAFVAPAADGVDAGRADRPRRRAARPDRLRAGARRRSVHRGRRPRAHRAGPPGRPRLAQRAARHRAAGVARRAAPDQRRAARLAGRASSPPATPSGASWSATSTTAPSSTSWRWRSSCASPRTLSTDDPADAESMIDEIRGDLQDAIAELRALAHGIFPPLLMSGGLGEALPAAAARAALPTGTEITVGPSLRRGRGGRLLLLHGGVAERRQARRRRRHRARQGVGETIAAVHWEVTDDGAGFDPASSAGVGPRLRQHARPHGCLRRHASRSSARSVPARRSDGHVPLR